jgi:hypothetical protein
MAKKKLKTVLTFVQDETGSMFDIADQTRSAFNEYFKTLKGDKEVGDVEVCVWQFSDTNLEDRVRPLYEGVLSKVPKLTTKNYRPRGITPLLDAVGTAIQQTEAKEADRYLFIVQTDGLENASKDFTREQVAKLVKKKEKAKNWTLVFLGTGIANWSSESGRQLGAVASSAVPFTVGQTVSAYRSAGAASTEFLRTNSVKGTVAADTLAGIDPDDSEEPKKSKKRSAPSA